MSDGDANDVITGSLELEERDLQAAIVDSSWLLRARFGIAAILAFSFGMGIFVTHVPAREMLSPIICGAVLVTVFFVTPRTRARKLLESLAQGGDRRASYRFDEEGVTLRTAGSTSTAAYRALTEYRDGKSAFLIYQAGVAHVIPKRAFSPRDLARVSARLTANVKRKGSGAVAKILVAWFAAILLFLVMWQVLNQPPTHPRATSAPPTAAP
jgi:hypothetical protein